LFSAAIIGVLRAQLQGRGIGNNWLRLRRPSRAEHCMGFATLGLSVHKKGKVYAFDAGND